MAIWLSSKTNEHSRITWNAAFQKHLSAYIIGNSLPMMKFLCYTYIILRYNNYIIHIQFSSWTEQTSAVFQLIEFSVNVPPTLGNLMHWIPCVTHWNISHWCWQRSKEEDEKDEKEGARDGSGEFKGGGSNVIGGSFCVASLCSTFVATLCSTFVDTLCSTFVATLCSTFVACWKKTWNCRGTTSRIPATGSQLSHHSIPWPRNARQTSPGQSWAGSWLH